MNSVALPPMTDAAEPIRLNKRMADLGLCSRREADAWIEQGWVKVNGAVAPMGLKVGLQDRIEVDPRARGQQAQQVTILLHKPVGYVSGQAEDGHQPAVTLVQLRNHWRGDGSRMRFSPQQLRGLAPAGRLDIDSVGLLVLTQDGRVARGSAWIVPADLHAPIRQDAVLLKAGATNPAATAFLDYLRSEPARAVLRAAGYAF